MCTHFNPVSYFDEYGKALKIHFFFFENMKIIRKKGWGLSKIEITKTHILETTMAHTNNFTSQASFDEWVYRDVQS